MKRAAVLFLVGLLAASVSGQNCGCSGECCSQYGYCGTTADYCDVNNGCKEGCWGNNNGGSTQGTYGPIDKSDRSGGDLSNMPVQASSAQDCQTQCFQNSACMSWAFDTCGSNCWLKSGSPSSGSANCRASGVITASRNGNGGNGGNSGNHNNTGRLTPNGKKAGLAGGTAFDFFQDHIGWWYDWTPIPQWHHGKPQAVGMLWGAGTHSDIDRQRWAVFQTMKNNTPNYFLGFNEPDCPGEYSAAMDSSNAAKIWNNNIAPMGKRGTKLGSPSMCMQTAESWLTPFSSQLSRAWDFTAIHVYKNSMDGVRKDIDYYYNKYKKPIWVTELGCVDDNGWHPSNNQDEITRFINDVVDLLEKDDRVHAYSYSDVQDLGDNYPLSRNGQLTTTGKVYLAAVSKYN